MSDGMLSTAADLLEAQPMMKRKDEQGRKRKKKKGGCRKRKMAVTQALWNERFLFVPLRDFFSL